MAVHAMATRLLVRDFDTCYAFYRDVMGLKPHWGDGTGGYASFNVDGNLLALFGREAMAEAVGVEDKPSTADTQNVVAICFSVDDVDAEFQRLVALGIEFDVEPVDRPDWYMRGAHFRDPDGNLIEISSALS